MKRQYQISVLAIALLGTPFAWANGTYTKIPVDTCIGSLCLDRKELTYQATKKMLGAGSVATVEKDEKDKKKLCYFDKQQELWLLIEFDTHSTYRPSTLCTIFVSTEQFCTGKIAPVTVLNELKTNGGVRIGMTEAELIKQKGQPDRVEDQVAYEKIARFPVADTLSAPRFGEKVIVYLNEDRGDFNFFYISNGIVKSMLVSDAE